MNILLEQYIKLLIEQIKRWGKQAAGVYIICPKTKRILLTLRSSRVLEPNTWGIPGGALNINDFGIEEYHDDTPILAVKREVMEEVGYGGEINIRPSILFSEENFKFHNFIGTVPDEFKAVLNWENSDAKWLTIDELLKISPKHFGVSWFLSNGGLEQIKNILNHDQ